MSTLVEDFRAGLVRGELLIQRCEDCSGLNLYPRYACPFCQSENLGWQAAGGRGILHTHTVQRLGSPEGFADELPFGLGVVKLEEGVQLMVRLVPDEDGEWSSYATDQTVEFVPPSVAEGGDAPRPLPWFKPAPTGA